jgi:hypothetical protein
METDNLRLGDTSAVHNPEGSYFPIGAFEQVGGGGGEDGPSAFQPGLPLFEAGDTLGELADLHQFALDSAEGPGEFVEGSGEFVIGIHDEVSFHSAADFKMMPMKSAAVV